MLDCFCNSGGFSLNAALTAKEVTAVDVSEFALANVRKNAELNGIANIKTEQADVFELLREKKKAGEKPSNLATFHEAEPHRIAPV